MRGYPRGFRGALLSIFALLFASGCLLLPTTLAMRIEWDMVWRLSADARIGMAALHVASAFGALTLCGSLWTFHMRAGFRQRKNYRNGLLLVGLLLALSLTGLGIFYLANESAALYAALGHAALGLPAPLLFGYHMIMGRHMARAIHGPGSHRREQARSNRTSVPAMPPPQPETGQG